ncbi:efflux RND transporter permease subunit [Paenibacillus sp. 1001270B_150601_E10]|uniref:efflux RND transporter permease subunit n=1 Tax=Paenibacillus sp. 1001270B_150601_E10 TaxID=2787079 RepID=UPI00189F4FBF|nr:efflux RND transporter permease subunit [Paenibacillus sp. 1001270B_150601_E10]
MNGLIRFTLNNKFAVWLMTIIVTAAGIYSGLNMKMETLPDITTPLVTVTTVYPGATPQEVADQVTKPIEQKVQNLSGVNVVSSSSFQNASQIQIEYDFETDMDKAVDEVKEVLADESFPEGVQSPQVSRLSFNAFPVMTYGISDEKQSLASLTKQVNDEILPKFEGLDGVAQVQITGQHVQEVQLAFDEAKLKQYGLTQDTVQGIIKGSDLKFPLGLYTFGDTEQSVLVDGKLTSIDALKSLQIPYTPTLPQGAAGASMGAPDGANSPGAMAQGGGSAGMTPGAGAEGAAGQGQGGAAIPPGASIQLPTVKLGELAKIEVIGKAESISRTNGKDAISLQIIKAADANTVEVVQAAKDLAGEFESRYPDIRFVSTFDQGEPIEESVQTMLSKAIFGAVFAMVIIMLFLRNLRMTLISVVSIPLSLIIGVLVLKQFDITLNIMTLGAMTVAIGRVVDDSIVVVENIYRRLSMKKESLKGMDLIREATKEMFLPIMSSTIVTIAVFLPLGLVKGMVGEMFLPFALTIVFSLLASLLVAITIVPMMAHSLFKKGIASKHMHHDDNPTRLGKIYKRLLEWCLNHKAVTSLIAVILLVGSLFLVPLVGVSFLPSDEEKMVIASFKPAPGQTTADVEKITASADEFFRGRKDVELVQYSFGGSNPLSMGQSNQALFFVKYKDSAENFSTEKDQVIKELQEQTEKGEWGSMDMMSGGFGGSSVQVQVFGQDLEAMKPVVEDLESRLSKIEGLKNVESSLTEAYDEYTLKINQEKLSQYGLTTAQVGMALSQQHSRPVLTTVKHDGKELNVYVQVEEPTYSKIDDLLARTLMSPLGQQVAVKDVVDVNKGQTSDTITRRDGRLMLQVSGEITESNVADVSKVVNQEIESIKVPAGMEISMGGVTEDIQESFTQLGIAMLAAIAIVYLILVITFGGGLAPFAILFSLPFTVIGAIVALLIAGETISISAMIGALMLIGIVVTNAIVLIDRVIHKESEGWSTREALLEAGATRLRPILMTAIATIGALIPLAIGMEGSGLISKGLGVTVIGGLTSSTLLTLVIVPIVYESLMKLRRKDKQQKAAA